MNFLDGQKTIITGAMMILIAFAGLLGIKITGFDPANAGMLLAEGFGLIFLRLGVKADTTPPR
jgi:hypothetical protein